jgi:hypothetical protein
MSEKPIYTVDNTRHAHRHSGRTREVILEPSGHGCYNAGETADQMAVRLLGELALEKATPQQPRSKKQN